MPLLLLALALVVPAIAGDAPRIFADMRPQFVGSEEVLVRRPRELINAIRVNLAENVTLGEKVAEVAAVYTNGGNGNQNFT